MSNVPPGRLWNVAPEPLLICPAAHVVVAGLSIVFVRQVLVDPLIVRPPLTVSFPVPSRVANPPHVVGPVIVSEVDPFRVPLVRVRVSIVYVAPLFRFA